MDFNGVLRSAVFFAGVIYGLAGFVFFVGISVGLGSNCWIVPMKRFILIVVLLVVAESLFAYDSPVSGLAGYWFYSPGNVNLASLPAAQCPVNQYYTFSNPHWECEAGGVRCRAYCTGTYISNGAQYNMLGVGEGYFHQCGDGTYFNGTSCAACSSSEVVNPYTKQCQSSCPPNDTNYADFETLSSKFGGTYTSGTYCHNGCEVVDRLTLDICAAINLPGYECLMQSVSLKYTGNFCGGGQEPPTSGQSGGCTGGYEKVGEGCAPACATGQTRGSDHVCRCGEGKELYGGECVAKCKPAEARNGSGLCEDNCFNGFRANADKSECVPLDCGENQEINYTLNQCVNKPVSCKEGTHREGILCVPDNKDCGPNTHWEAGCNKCVKDGSPIGTCGATSGDMDGDGKPDSTDDDLDGDGIPNSSDSDADGDGIPNSSDSDDDNDGVPDANDPTPQGPGTTNPLTKCVGPNCDTDGDGIPDGQDPDANGNGIPDDQETEKAGKAGSPLGDLYESKGLTLAAVWSEFSARVSYSAIAVSTSTFFSMASISASCPVWTIPASAFYPAITIDLFCSAAITGALQLAGLVVLIVAVWVAFRIALL